MQHKRILAVAVAATMLIGSTVTAFADDATGATGTGTSFDHVNKEITSVKLPTTSDVANVFNYYVDPERLINDAGTLADGTTAVTGNNDGVYFANAGSAAVDAQDGTAKFTRTGTDTDAYTVTGVDLSKNATYTYNGTDSKWEDGEGEEVSGISVKDGEDAAVTAEDGDTIVVSGAVAAQAAGSATYSSASDAVSFEGRNSVAVDVSVKAEIKEADAKETDIELVADADALAAATGPALLMQLKVGTDTKAVTSSGTTASATIDGKADNFEVKTDSGKYVYQAKSDATGWNSTTVQLIGKTNEKDVPTGAGAMTAPKITLT